MNTARLEISIYDGLVIFHGEMTIREAFDFLNYFDREGYNIVTVGQENSSICLKKGELTTEQKSYSFDSKELGKELLSNINDIIHRE